MRAAKIVAIVIGALLIIIGLALLIPGVVVLGITGAQTDGFFTTSDQVLTSTGHALATGDVDMDIGRADWITSGGIGVVRIRASSTGSAPVFVGIGQHEREIVGQRPSLSLHVASEYIPRRRINDRGGDPPNIPTPR